VRSFGVEEEFLLVDARTGNHAPVAENLLPCFRTTRTTPTTRGRRRRLNRRRCSRRGRSHSGTGVKWRRLLPWCGSGVGDRNVHHRSPGARESTRRGGHQDHASHEAKAEGRPLSISTALVLLPGDGCPCRVAVTGSVGQSVTPHCQLRPETCSSPPGPIITSRLSLFPHPAS
jgi:hypothetical protein